VPIRSSAPRILWGRYSNLRKVVSTSRWFASFNIINPNGIGKFRARPHKYIEIDYFDYYIRIECQLSVNFGHPRRTSYLARLDRGKYELSEHKHSSTRQMSPGSEIIFIFLLLTPMGNRLHLLFQTCASVA
jgi:hypothetical protein